MVEHGQLGQSGGEFRQGACLTVWRVMVVEFFAYAGAVWWSVAAALFCVTLICGLAQPWVRRRRATRQDRPPISAIIPVKLLDPGFEIAQTSLFAQDYPAYEVLIGAAEEVSPALDAARRIAAAHPRIACWFLHSASVAAVSPKLNTLAAPLAAALKERGGLAGRKVGLILSGGNIDLDLFQRWAAPAVRPAPTLTEFAPDNARRCEGMLS